MKTICAVIAAVSLVHASAFACTHEPLPRPLEIPAQLPDETQSAYEARMTKFGRAFERMATVQRLINKEKNDRESQARQFDISSQVIVAQVLRFDRSPEAQSMRSIIVVPRFWLKGTGTRQEVRLTNYPTSCGPRGNASFSSPPDFVVLFAPSGPIEDHSLVAINQFDIKDQQLANALESRGIYTVDLPGRFRVLN